MIDRLRDALAGGLHGVLDLLHAVGDRIGNLLHARANLSVNTITFDRQWLIDKSATAVDEYKLKDLRITSIDSSAQGQDVVITMDVSTNVEFAAMSADAPSTWQLTWTKSPKEYLLRDIRCLKLPGGMDLSSIVSRLRSRASVPSARPTCRTIAGVSVRPTMPRMS